MHVVIFLFALVFATRSFGAGETAFGWGLLFFALAEISYLTYHVNVTLFLFAHTISEVLVLLGTLVIAGAAARKGLFGRSVREAAQRTAR